MFRPLVLLGHSIHKLEGIDNEAINQAVLARKDMKLDDNTGNTFTEDSYYPEDNPACKALVDAVNDVIKKEVNEHFSTFNTWAHILGPNEQTMYHTHDGMQSGPPGISWVYYSKTPKGAGNIVWAVGVDKQRAMVEHEPQEGELILFPDFVPHFTKKNVSGSTRISISGNAKPSEQDIQKVGDNPGNLFNYIGIFNG